MTTSKKDRRKQVKSLKKAHDRRASLINKVAKAREKFEKRSRKLQDVENRIAELSRAVFGVAEPAANGEREPDATRDVEAMAALDAGEHAAASAGNPPAAGAELPDDPAASE